MRQEVPDVEDVAGAEAVARTLRRRRCRRRELAAQADRNHGHPLGRQAEPGDDGAPAVLGVRDDGGGAPGVEPRQRRHRGVEERPRAARVADEEQVVDRDDARTARGQRPLVVRREEDVDAIASERPGQRHLIPPLGPAAVERREHSLRRRRQARAAVAVDDALEPAGGGRVQHLEQVAADSRAHAVAQLAPIQADAQAGTADAHGPAHAGAPAMR